MEKDNVQLISSRSFSRSRERSIRKPNRDGELLHLSDSEIGKSSNGADSHEETTVFSDSLYGGDSLPSMRAQIAATQMQYRTRKRRDLESSTNEGKVLFASSDEDTESSSATVLRRETPASGALGKYSSLGGSIIPKKRSRKELMKMLANYFKVTLLTAFIVGCVIMFAVNQEHEGDHHYISTQNKQPKVILYTEVKSWKFVTVDIEGPFLDVPYHNGTQDNCLDFVFVCGLPDSKDTAIEEVDPCPNEGDNNCYSFQTHTHNELTTFTKSLSYSRDSVQENDTFTVMFMTLSNETSIEFKATIVGETLEEVWQIVIAAIILVGVYILIGFDIVHRTLAAFIGSTCTLAVLSMIGKRPTLEETVEWLDLDTICLLFGMMTLVGIFSQTGFFDYSAVKAYKIARGKVWPLITLLCLFSAVVSAFLDNVTTILLLTPVSIRLCQVLNLDPRPVLIAEVVFSNIGGTATAIGDPPNVIIVSNSLIQSVGINFAEFTLHLFLGILLAMVAAYGLLSLIYYVSFIRVKNKDPPHIAELKREIAIWKRTAERLNVVSLEERAVRDAILAKADDVQNQLNQEATSSMHSSKDMWQKNLAELESKYRITNWVLLIKSSSVLVVVIFMFFMSHTLPSVELHLGWIAIFGGIVLLILSDIQDLESILHKIEWGTLLFFAGLFVLMEGLGELGLIRFIGDLVVEIIKNVDKEHQMLVAIILILWVSAIASAFIDNIPFTTATIPVVWELANSQDLCLSIRPLVWALAFGACLGGNGTLIGASANVVCAGIAEQNGYKISFFSFLKIGFPMMLVTTLTAMIYLLICHEAFDWDITDETKQCVYANATALY